MELKDILNLIIPDNFGSDDESCDTPVLEDVYNQLDNTVYTAYGVSQFVIIPKNEDEQNVYKIPFEGEYFWVEEDDAFTGFDPYNVDYCALTCDIYEKAADANVNLLFAKTSYIGSSANNKPIYMQERIMETESDHYFNHPDSTPSKNSLDLVKKKVNKHTWTAWDYFTESWLASAVDFYGYNYVERAIDFLTKEQINDFHQNNYGYRFDGSPVIFDFCGFNNEW